MQHLKRIQYFGVLFIFALCALLWAWNEKEAHGILKTEGELSLLVGLTPIERSLFFDYPSSMGLLNEMIVQYKLFSIQDVENLSAQERRLWNKLQAAPMWKGVAALLLTWYKTGNFGPKEPIMEKIRQGEVWRFFTPCLLHKDLFHLLFNMSWLWILGCQIEARLSRIRFFLLIGILGVISNTAQYLMGGPYFLGFSGVVAGMAGFIWMRQKKAPQEKYPLPKPAALFLFYCILAMMSLEAILFIVQMIFPFTTVFNIANTAHIVGGVTGLMLGRGVLFARRRG